MKIGAQLYTVHRSTKTLEGLSEALKKIADIGYTTVQVSGTCAYEADWLKAELDKNGLSCVLTHIKPQEILDDPVQVCRNHDIFDCKHIGIGAMPRKEGNSGIDDECYDTFVKNFLPVAKIFRQEGHKLFYHNHQIEFARSANGMLYFDRMLEDFSPELLGITYDTYWAQIGGVEPSEYLKKLVGRVECIHLKDLAIVEKEQRMAPVGQGNLNFEKILKVAESVGVEYLLVEQDNCYDKDPFDCLKESYQYLTSFGLQ
ncbi:MAG: sugar phosphate isomerase/epimerase [Ruminococcaceae bacterium]|nr:sugar phosphate isomerase/epimerase [Oscillospiraceae bacterium]